MLAYIEQSQFTEWFLTSMWGFPTFIALHSVGMAFVVGLSVIVAFRHLLPSPLTPRVIKVLIRAAWLGFLLNLVTGLALLASRISEYLADTTFLVKLLFIFAGVVCLKLLQQRIYASQASGAADVSEKPDRQQIVLGVSLLFTWLAAITAGRWIAYLSSLYGAS